MKKNIWWSIRKLKLPGVVLLLGLVAMFYGNRIVKETMELEAWSSTKGEIVVSKLKKSNWRENTPSVGTRGVKQEMESRYTAQVEYEYQVQDEFYTGSEIRLIMPMHRTPEEVQPLLDLYPKGKRVTVYYDMEDPAKSVLESVLDEDTYTLFYMGIMWSAVWGMVLLVAAIVVYVKEARR